MKLVKSEKGFTLIEMLVVLLIITILIFVAIPNITKHSKNINNKGCEAFVNMVQGQVEAYEMEFNKYPTDVSELIKEKYLKEDRKTCPNGNSVRIDSDGKVTESKGSNS
ncbi:MULTISPECIES: competence type IV pilus major pilin ComGC [Heyndrickxia]|uniref:competence type IV pilus major pilin ComGC n=1 Tax=Heyndrickxia TaxID=2837504 RepID=UPI0009FAE51E|nr:competence type IV pilus major pilin ComGC [Heyndrickxia shackletonii]MBB2482166.1 prepilin-type N-terminal cleavage/methylation domain-containing protein [Bacillus sp. APMAM]NEY99640.1 prepilin-type N-terminal cleavage/methylation domain-containing protein [Heyndrickxia shackletonii]RTZ54509.1 prepilin-type N-terminal cleavage/methylation domain-containing protein [Bacillus sp. SAJ1]